MKLNKIIITASLALLPLTAGAATLIIPAAASTNGANGSNWKSEVTLHNTSAHAINVNLRFHDQAGAAESGSVSLAARSTMAFKDIVRTEFDRQNALGAIEITVADADANRLAVSSRTANATAGGEFGQDIPAIDVASASNAGDLAVITGPTSALDFRFNAGLYTLADTTIRWELIRENGTVAASRTIDYAAGVQNQFSVSALLGAELNDNDVLHAVVVKGSAIFYGSIINQMSGDPSFVPGVRTREQARITLLGIDRDQNGTIDIATHENVLDSAVDSYTMGFPTFFRIVTSSENGDKVRYEVVSSTADARFVDDNGTVQIVASAALKGTTGELKVRATTADGQSIILTIPVQFF
ncbi:MAG: hypothetical protein ACXW3E_01920 [Thermoanaerobaculia bacterium]